MASLPGLSLPGLSLTTPTPQPSATLAPPLLPARTQDLPARSELRFEAPFSRPYTIRLLRGTAEIFGTELALSTAYTFSGTKAAVFTWHGCALELQGEAESEYVAQETDAMTEWLNLHGGLESLRAQGAVQPDGGPRVMVVGPEGVGKTSLAKTLVAWALKMGRAPTLVNLDAREGVLGVPGALSAATVAGLLDVEDASGGWGSAPISGPTALPVKNPLVYHFPFASSEEMPGVFRPLVTRAALAVTSKMEEEARVKESGIVIDTPGSLNQPKGGYENLVHVVGEFSVSVLLVLGSERLYNDMARRFASPKNPEDAVTVLRIPTTGGAVTRDEAFMRQVRQQQIKTYFFGDARAPLNPHAQWWDFAELAIYRVVDQAHAQSNLSFLPGMDDDDDVPAARASSDMFERVTPGQGMVNALLAIKFATGNAAHENIRDSCVMGFVYVAEVDEGRKKVRFLAPHPTRWGDRALVMGNWPEQVTDLVA